MLNSYFITFLRNVKKNKLFTLIIILGLSIGITVFMLLIQFIKYESSYDKFHSNHENLYRLQYNFYKNNIKEFESAKSPAIIAKQLNKSIPEIINYCRTTKLNGEIITEQNSFRDDNIYFSTPSIFKMFSIPLVQGDTSQVLMNPNTCVLSESASLKYFGHLNTVGKTIHIDINRIEQKEYQVGGVFKDIPDNSHIKCNILISYQTLINETFGYADHSWDWYDFYNYVEIKIGVNTKELQNKINIWLQNERKETWNKSNIKQEFVLQPIQNIHLYSNLSEECHPLEQGDYKSVYFLTIVAIIVIIIAWFNYIILATTQSFERAREIGVRKVLSASKIQLIQQFLVEALIINTCSFILALILMFLFKPVFIELTGIGGNIVGFQTISFWMIFLLMLCVSILASGFVPSLIISKFNTTKVLKGKMSKSPQGVKFRKILIIIQYSICIFLIASTLTIYKQMRYVQNKELGFSIGNKLIVHTPIIGATDSALIRKSKVYKNEILNLSQVNGAALSSTIPGDEITFREQFSRSNDNQVIMSFIIIDDSYFTVYDIPILEGRNFRENTLVDKNAVILNKKAVYALGFNDLKECIGKSISMQGKSWEIIGVASNYNHLSLKSELFPIAFFNTENFPGQFYSIEISGNGKEATVQLKKIWDRVYGDKVFNSYLLDDRYYQQYNNDRLFLRVFLLFTIIAILITNLGMVGFSLNFMQQKKMELGLKNLFGCSINSLVMSMLSIFAKIVFISGIIVLPIWFIVVKKWLQSFAVRIDISFYTYIIAIFITIVLLTLTVIFQTIKAAKNKPVNTLRCE